MAYKLHSFRPGNRKRFNEILMYVEWHEFLIQLTGTGPDQKIK